MVSKEQVKPEAGITTQPHAEGKLPLFAFKQSGMQRGRTCRIHCSCHRQNPVVTFLAFFCSRLLSTFLLCSCLFCLFPALLFSPVSVTRLPVCALTGAPLDVCDTNCVTGVVCLLCLSFQKRERLKEVRKRVRKQCARRKPGPSSSESVTGLEEPARKKKNVFETLLGLSVCV